MVVPALAHRASRGRTWNRRRRGGSSSGKPLPAPPRQAVHTPYYITGPPPVYTPHGWGTKPIGYTKTRHMTCLATTWAISPTTWHPHTPRTDDEARELERRAGHHRGAESASRYVRRRYADRSRLELDAAISNLRAEATRAGHWDVCRRDVLAVATQRLAASERPPALPLPPPPKESTMSLAFIAWHLPEAAAYASAYAAEAAATGVPLPTATPVDSHYKTDVVEHPLPAGLNQELCPHTYPLVRVMPRRPIEACH